MFSLLKSAFETPDFQAYCAKYLDEFAVSYVLTHVYTSQTITVKMGFNTAWQFSDSLLSALHITIDELPHLFSLNLAQLKQQGWTIISAPEVSYRVGGIMR